MNEFVEQFLIECRELVELATDDLLTLEGRPSDKERLDSAFRAFHTLKGAAGIVDFDAMGRALHAAEDVLSSVRGGGEPVTSVLIGDCLTCLDQVVQWLDAMEGDGAIPAGADAAADAIVRRFARELAPIHAAPSAAWQDRLLARHPGGSATVAILYQPDPEAFFRGEDPLALLAQVPELIAVELVGEAEWPPLDQLDPFTSRLTFGALAACSTDEALRALNTVASQVAVVGLSRAAPIDNSSLSAAARTLLEAQLGLLSDSNGDGFAGRLASAGRVASNVLRRSGRPGDSERLRRMTEESQATRDAQRLAEAIRAALAGTLEAEGSGAETLEAQGPAEAAARTLRVDVERIDALVSLTGELLVAKNALGHATALAQEGAEPAVLAALLKDQHAALGRLVDELQRSVLNIRVLPMRYVFQRFPRLVREMVVSLGKPAHLMTQGEDTEADKVIVESLFEPLLHVIRNALDHGIEPTAVRVAAEKPASATIRLGAHRRGEHVVIEVADDGAGVDVDRVRTVAAERGVATVEALAEMTEQEIVDLIFAPGFSTAGQVTNLSGRGVGMDAVRSAVERLGGRVGVESRAGQGTLVRFTLPFAVMMSRVLTVEAGGQMFGVPLDAVLETVRVSRDRVKPVGAARAFVLRDRTVPVVDLARALGAREEGGSGEEANIVIATTGGHLGGLEVDRLGERLDVMLKPLEGLLSGIPGIAGTTLLGDGRVLIVLDLQALLQ